MGCWKEIIFRMKHSNRWPAANAFPWIWLVLLAGVTLTGAEVILYPAPDGLPASPKFAVKVLAGGIWMDAYVNFDASRTAGSGSRDEPGKTFSWVTFETSAPVRLRVRRLEGGFNRSVVRPSRHGIRPTRIEPDAVEFAVKPGQKVSVEFDSDIKPSCYDGAHGIPCVKNIMMIFADPLKRRSALADVRETDICRVKPGSHENVLPVSGASGMTAGKCMLGSAGGKKVVVFDEGVHHIGYWQVPNNIEHIHLEGGAVVFGAIDVIPQGREPFHDAATISQVYRRGWSNEKLRAAFKLTGPGILSGARLPWHLKKDFSYTSGDDWWAHVKLLQLAVENITLEDVTLANSPHWVLTFMSDSDRRSKGIFDNFKMVGAWTYNNDGLPNPAGPDSRIANAFIHADDDAFKIYNGGSTIENCVVWQSSNGAVFQFGWFPKTVSDVTVSTIDIIHFENWYGRGQPNRAVFNYANASGSGTISNMRFSDINIEGRVLRLFGFKCDGKANRQKIRDFTFTSMTCGGMGVGHLGGPGANYFMGDITGFKFHNFIFGGSPVGSLEQARSQARFEFSRGAGAGFSFKRAAPLPEACTGD